MTAPRRPSTTRKVTPKDEAKRTAGLDEGIRFKVATEANPEGEWFYLRPADVTSVQAREIRKVTGRSFRRLIELVADDPDVDVIEEALWVARLLRGEDIPLSDVTFDYADLMDEAFDIDQAGPRNAAEVDGADPEGQGEPS